MKASKLILPPGWTAEDEDECNGDRVLIRDTRGLMMTVDFVVRGFALGSVIVVSAGSGYEGRGWPQRLVADAVKALRAVP